MIFNSKSKEIKLNPIKSMVSRADLKGIIRYSNYYYREVSGYSQVDLIGMSDKITLHQDMPRIIYELMWDRIKNDEEMLALVKYITKDGDYYWAATLFKTKYHPITKEFNGYLALSHKTSSYAIKHIELLYKDLLLLKAEDSLAESQTFLIDFLTEEDKTYDEFIEALTQQKESFMDKLKDMKYLLPSTISKIKKS